MSQEERRALKEGVEEVLHLCTLPEEEARKEIAQQLDLDEDDLETFNATGLW